MMAQAIKDIGLEPYYVQITRLNILKETAYAYLQCQIPVVLIFELWRQSKPGSIADLIGLHAASVAGFRLGDDNVRASNEFSITAKRITKLYAHDDQVGPFARMEFDGEEILRPAPSNPSRPEAIETLSTSFTILGGNTGDARAVPIALLVPLYHKIRIPYISIHEAVRSFDHFIKLFVERFFHTDRVGLEWDIGLTTGTDLKRQILESAVPNVPRKARNEILCGSFPRFLWKASAYRDDSLLLDLLFDATDIEHGEFFVRAIEWDKHLASLLRIISKIDMAKIGLFDSTETQAAQKIIAWFREQPETDAS